MIWIDIYSINLVFLGISPFLFIIIISLSIYNNNNIMIIIIKLLLKKQHILSIYCEMSGVR